MLTKVYTIIVLIIMMINIYMIDTAHISGIFDPFDENKNDSIVINETHPNVNLPSLDSIHDHVHQSLDTNDTISNETHFEQAGPSLDLIDSHRHSHDDDNSSIIESAKRALIQPSIDFLDAQLHGGNEHVHEEKSTDNQTNDDAADLNDYKRWLEEQNQTNQLTRFLLLQKEINQFNIDNRNDLSEKLNRTIEELKLEKQQQPKYDL